MTDLAIQTRTRHTSEDAKRLLARRYAREARFKALGLSAIIAAILFLATLLTSIVWQGFPAFFQHYVALEIDFAESVIDPDGSRQAATLANANYATLVRNALVAEFPGVSGRTERRALAGLTSNGAGFALRDEVLAAPELIGTKKLMPIILSDTSDLYLKHDNGAARRIPTAGDVSPSAVTGAIDIVSTGPDFKVIFDDLKRALGPLAADLERAQGREERVAASLRQDLAAAESAGAAPRAEELRGQIAAAESRAADLAGQAADLRRRMQAEGGSERLLSSMPSYFLHINGGVIDLTEIGTTSAKGNVVIPLSTAERAATGNADIVVHDMPESQRKITDAEIIWLEALAERGKIEQRLSTPFFTAGASREAELAGIWGAVVGSFYTMIVTLLLAFPVGVGAAIYLEEFAPKNRWTELIEVNIANLAAVPSIVFGLLGLAVFLNVFGLPRSAPLAGGVVLAMMTLPIVIIASRASLKAVPPSIREAALGVGASKVQTVFHHVVPLAMPGMMTGTIIGMAHALGETAPLLMIGMVAFIVDIPSGPLDAAVVLPVQIYMWAEFPEPAFAQKTAAAIMILLAFLISMNAIAVLLRKRFERRW